MLSILVGSLLLTSCHKSENSDEQILRIDGSSTVFPLSEAIAEEFVKKNPQSRLTIGISGTGGGMRKFSRGEISIANASRRIKDIEDAECVKNNIEYLEVPIAYDGLAIITNKKNEWLKEITIDELKKIWQPEAQNTVLYWDQVRPYYPHKAIQLFGPGTASGTFDFFTEVIVGEAGSSRGDFMPSEDDHVLIQGVAGDLYSLGFVGLAYYEENLQRVRLVALNNDSKVVVPDHTTITEGQYKPLTREIFIYISKRILATKDGVKFVEYFLQTAGQLAEDVGFVSLTNLEYEEQLDRFHQFIKAK